MSPDQSDLPPPSYNDSVSAVTRQPPFSLPDSIETHHVIAGPGAASISLPFPEPGGLWQSRDISVQDWTAFASDITAALDANSLDTKKKTEMDKDKEKRLAEVVQGWNTVFFEKRGLRVILNGEDAVGGTSSSASSPAGGGGASRFSFGPNKFGVQVGGGLFGVDFSSKKGTLEK